MTLAWLVLVHWMHVLAGAIWFGGAVFYTVAVWPTVLRLPMPEAKAYLESVNQAAGPWMGGAAATVVLLGIVRGTVLGPIRSLDALFSSAYGLTFLAALALTISLMVYGGRARGHLAERIWDDAGVRPGAAEYLRRGNVVSLATLTMIVLCMVLMRFGL